MNWLLFFAWLVRRSRTQRCAALARAWLGCIMRDTARYTCGLVSPASARKMRVACNQLILLSHILVAAYIHRRAREIAGLKPLPLAFDPDAAPRRLSSLKTLRKRARELLRRLDRAEVHARKLAAKLTAWKLEETLGALSGASPAEAGAQPQLGSVQSTPSFFLISPFERSAHFLGATRPRPPPGMRVAGFVPRDGPPTPKPQQIQPFSPQRLAA